MILHSDDLQLCSYLLLGQCSSAYGLLVTVHDLAQYSGVDPQYSLT